MTKYLDDLIGKKTGLLKDEPWALSVITVVYYKKKNDRTYFWLRMNYFSINCLVFTILNKDAYDQHSCIPYLLLCFSIPVQIFCHSFNFFHVYFFTPSIRGKHKSPKGKMPRLCSASFHHRSQESKSRFCSMMFYSRQFIFQRSLKCHSSQLSAIGFICGVLYLSIYCYK